MKQMTIITFGVIFYWFLDIIFIERKTREKRIVNIDILIANLIKVKKREKQISIVTINKRKAYKKESCITDNILPVT